MKNHIAEIEKNIHRKEITLDTNNYVVMANNMVLHSASNLTLNELKLLRFIIMQTEKDDRELYEFSFSAKDLAHILQTNIKTHDLYKKIKGMTKHILSEVIEIEDDKTKKWKQFHWVDECSYDNGIINIKIAESLKPYLLELKGSFTRYHLSEIVKLNSIYGIRLYEILNSLMDDNNLPHADISSEFSISLEALRKATNTENKFERPYDFKKKVIDKAVKEINDKSVYHVTAKPYKNGRAIVGFEFLVESQAGYWHRTKDEESEKAKYEDNTIQLTLFD